MRIEHISKHFDQKSYHLDNDLCTYYFNLLVIYPREWSTPINKFSVLKK